MMPALTVSVVIAARNEQERIAVTVTAAHALPDVIEVIVVSDGSSDDTVRQAQLAGAHVISLPRRRGKGGAMEAGATIASGDLLLFLDADLEDSAAEALPLIRPVQTGEADITVALFPVLAQGAGGWGNVARLSRTAIRLATGYAVAAPLSGQRCLRRDVWKTVRPLAYGFGVETAMTLDALLAGFKVREIPTGMRHRVTGRDLPGTLHRVHQLFDILLALTPRISHVFSRYFCMRIGLHRPNFRGESIPAAAGLTYLLPLALLALLPIPEPGKDLARIASIFGLLGLVDDLWGNSRVRGLRGHLRSLFSGRVTTGAIKLIVGSGAALWASSRLHTSVNLLALCINALLIAVSANTVNLLDLRPGRAQSAFLFLIFPGAFALCCAKEFGEMGIILSVLLIAVLMRWRSDASGRSMMGDTGANLLGAAAGWISAAFLPEKIRFLMMFSLLILNVTAERISLSKLIERTPWLNALDRRLGVR